MHNSYDFSHKIAWFQRMSSIYPTDVEACKRKMDLSSNFEKNSKDFFKKNDFSPPISTNLK